MSFPRHRAYKESGAKEIATVPEHWSVVRLKDVLARRITDGPHTTPNFQDYGVPFLSVDGIQDGELQFDGCRFVSEDAHAEYRKKAAPERDDLLMGKAASTGKIARVKVDFEFSIWSPLALIRIDKSAAVPAYVEYALKCPIAQAQIENLCTSNTQKNISMDDIPRLVLALAPLSEQFSIVNFLHRETAKIDALVEEQQRLIELLKEKRQAVISQAVTKGLAPNVPMKDSGVEWLGKVPAHWEIGPLKRFWTVTDCKHITAEFVEGGIPLASIREVQGWSVDLSGAKQTTEHFYDQLIEGGRKPVAGDILFTRNATVGEAALVPEDPPLFAMGQDVCLFRRIELAYSAPFMLRQLKSAVIATQLEGIMIGSTFKRINVEEIRCLTVCMPPVDEQREIAAELEKEADRFDALLDAAIQASLLLQERRAALISAAVTGKIDVRGVAS